MAKADRKKTDGKVTRAGAEAAVREIESGGEHESVVVLGGGPWQEKTLPAQSLQRVSTAGKL